MCNCIDLTNKALEHTNTRVDAPLRTNLKTGAIDCDRVLVPTCKRDSGKRERAMPIFANYCPLCGERYSEPAAAVVEGEEAAHV